MWFLVFYVIFLVFMLRKWNLAVIFKSDKWVAKNKISIILHYYFWRKSQEHFSIILSCEWFLFQNHLIISVLISPLNYFLVDSSTMVHHTNIKLLWCHDLVWWRPHPFKVIWPVFAIVLAYIKSFKSLHIMFLFSPISHCCWFSRVFLQHNNNILTIKIEKYLTLSWIRLGTTVFPLRGGWRTLPTYEM